MSSRRIQSMAALIDNIEANLSSNCNHGTGTRCTTCIVKGLILRYRREFQGGALKGEPASGEPPKSQEIIPGPGIQGEGADHG